CLSLFWGLVPHQIIDFSGSAPYYVCTIPLTLFLEWKLPSVFIDRILKGEVVTENSGAHSVYDEFLLKSWLHDLSENKDPKATLFEMRARLLRLSSRVIPSNQNDRLQIHSGE